MIKENKEAGVQEAESKEQQNDNKKAWQPAHRNRACIHKLMEEVAKYAPKQAPWKKEGKKAE